MCELAAHHGVARQIAGVTLAGDASSIVGKAFIVHEKADDLKTQPTGDAGGRVACGVIRLDAR